MRAKSVTDFRKNLASELDRVVSDREPLVVHRSGGKPPVVVLPLGDYEMDATDYLLSNPENARRLMESIRELEQGKTVAFALPDED